jgi:hypothetical protein
MMAKQPSKRNWRYWRNIGAFTIVSIFIGVLAFFYIGHPYYLSRVGHILKAPRYAVRHPLTMTWNTRMYRSGRSMI